MFPVSETAKEEPTEPVPSRKRSKQVESNEFLAKLFKLLGGKKSSLKQTMAANEKAESDAWENKMK